MGKTNRGYGRSVSKSKQSSLANTQEQILQQREKFFQDYFLPEFQEAYSSLDPASSVGAAQMGQAAQQVNTSFNTAQKQTNQMLAQRNLGNTGAGAALTAANNRARSSALANAYATQTANSADKKITALSSLGQLMPQTTTAAPMQDESRQSQSSYGGLLSSIF